MRKIIIITTIVGLLFYFGIGAIFIKGVQNASVEMKSGEKIIGELLVVQGDTLMITDYSFFTKSYTLSNGSLVHEKLAKKTLINRTVEKIEN